MSENINSNNNNNTRSTQIIHNNGTWADTIRTIFIYGAAAARYTAVRTRPGQVFVVAAAVGTELGTRFAQNAINDPNYILEHYNNWNIIWDRDSNQTVRIFTNSNNFPSPSDSNNYVPPINPNFDPNSNFISNNFDSSFIESINSQLKPIFDYIVGFLNPVTVDYPNTLLAQQIHGLAIFLFIICISIIILFIAFSFNMIILLYREKLIGYFTNKYIVAYLKLQTHIILFEIIFFFSLILYSLYNLAIGIHFIATHPIIININ
jgi:hypothetical protein